MSYIKSSFISNSKIANANSPLTSFANNLLNSSNPSFIYNIGITIQSRLLTSFNSYLDDNSLKLYISPLHTNISLPLLSYKSKQ